MPGSGTVLIVEDDRLQRDLAVQLVQSFGHSAMGLEGDAQLFNALGRIRPSVILLDILLKEGSGVDLCRKIRSHYPDWSVPILMMTARGLPEDVAAAKAAGADDYMVKPVKPDVLEAKLSRWIGRRSLAVEASAVRR